MSVVTPILSYNVCDVTRAGIRVIWVIDCSEVQEITIDPDTRIVTDVQLAPGSFYKRIEFERDTAFLEQGKSVIKSSVNYVQLITIYEAGLNNEVRNALEDLNRICCLHVIVEDNSGNKWYCGISYFQGFETWQSEDMRTGDGYGNSGADPATDSAEYLETFVANTFNYALLTEIDPATEIGETAIFAQDGIAFAQDGIAFAN